jgi:alcohol dehydrogenase, propanol-preferring
VLAYVFDPAAGRAALTERPEPGPPAEGELLLAVEACGLCRTDLHILDGDLRPPGPVTLGHQIVGQVLQVGGGVDRALIGRRVGVPWLAGACGGCRECLAGRENLCAQARFTGFHRDGGLAARATAAARACLPLPEGLAPVAGAPLLCAGLIGWRALRLAGDGPCVGLYGFGAAAHLLTQVLRWQGRRVFAFTRPGDRQRQAYARALGAEWAGDSDQCPEEALDAAILFADSGALVPRALEACAPGGVVVCAEIHMSDIPSFPYRLLWQERVLRSVANLTHQDGVEYLPLAAAVPVRADTTVFALAEIDRAIAELRDGRVRGAAVITP